jgi:hypothetical protein
MFLFHHYLLLLFFYLFLFLVSIFPYICPTWNPLFSTYTSPPPPAITISLLSTLLDVSEKEKKLYQKEHSYLRVHFSREMMKGKERIARERTAGRRKRGGSGKI